MKLKGLGDVGDKLKNNLRRFVVDRGFSKVVVGVSGGIDSAVVLCLAQAAFGSDNVFAVTMPSTSTSEDTLNDAHRIARNLGVFITEINIENAACEMFSAITHSELECNVDSVWSKDLDNELALENVQARVRGSILMGIANRSNALVLATGNKTESMMGYCTLYGDTVGAVEVLGNLYKCQVYEMAHEINKKNYGDAIPQSIIDRPPSAELSDGQTDEKDMGISYEKLDRILMRIEKNKFKLEQCPPALDIK